MTTNAPNINFETAMMQGNDARAAEKLGQLKTAGKTRNMEQIEDAAIEFEAVFLSEMLKPMFEGIKPDPMFGGGNAEKTFKGLMVQEYGELMARSGGLGLAEHVKAELIRIQEGQEGPQSQAVAQNMQQQKQPQPQQQPNKPIEN